MSRLSDLYNAMETLRKEGVSTDDLEQKVSELEEEIIKNEILPVVTETIAPALKQVQRELVLVVDYNPNYPIQVHLSRKTSITQILKDAKIIGTSGQTNAEEIEPNRYFNPLKTEPHIPTKQILNKTRGLKVTFPDGTVFNDNTALSTMKKTLKKIGLERVANCPVEAFRGYRLVSKTMRPSEGDIQWQQKEGEYYIYTNISNKDKIDRLTKISDLLNLDLKIEYGDK